MANVLSPEKKEPSPIFFPPLNSDERRLWIDVYAAAIRHGIQSQACRAIAEDAVREYRSSVKPRH